MRKRINANAVCSSENYAASKRIHKAMLKRVHSTFGMTVVSDSKPLSLKRQVALDNMPVVVKVLALK